MTQQKDWDGIVRKIVKQWLLSQKWWRLSIAWNTDLEKLVTKVKSGVGKGWPGGLGLACAHWCLRNDWPTGTLCIAHKTLPNILDGCLYIYNWSTMLYSRNYHSIVNQLYFNKTWKCKKENTAAWLRR